MDVHPLFVHFPIALLSCYAILEMLRWKKLTDKPYMFYLKACLVILGTLGAFVSLQTGEIAEHEGQYRGSALVEMHSFWAATSTWIFGIISVLYLLSWASKEEWISFDNAFMQGVWKKILHFEFMLLNSWTILLLAFLGLVSITITGALGGAIVYGPDADPIVQFIYNLFF